MLLPTCSAPPSGFKAAGFQTAVIWAVDSLASELEMEIRYSKTVKSLLSLPRLAIFLEECSLDCCKSLFSEPEKLDFNGFLPMFYLLLWRNRFSGVLILSF